MDPKREVDGVLLIAAAVMGFLTMAVVAMLISELRAGERGPVVAGFWLLVWVLGTYLVARGTYASGTDIQRWVDSRTERLRPAREKQWMERNPGHSRPAHAWEWVQAAVTVRCRECGCWGGRPAAEYLES